MEYTITIPEDFIDAAFDASLSANPHNSASVVRRLVGFLEKAEPAHPHDDHIPSSYHYHPSNAGAAHTTSDRFPTGYGYAIADYFHANID